MITHSIEHELARWKAAFPGKTAEESRNELALAEKSLKAAIRCFPEIAKTVADFANKVREIEVGNAAPNLRAEFDELKRKAINDAAEFAKEIDQLRRERDEARQELEHISQNLCGTKVEGEITHDMVCWKCGTFQTPMLLMQDSRLEKRLDEKKANPSPK